MISILYPSISYLNNSPSCRKQKQNCENFYLFRLYLIIIIKNYTKYPTTTNVRRIHLVPTMSRSIPVPYMGYVGLPMRAMQAAPAARRHSSIGSRIGRGHSSLDRLPGMQRPPRPWPPPPIDAGASDRS